MFTSVAWRWTTDASQLQCFWSEILRERVVASESLNPKRQSRQTDLQSLSSHTVPLPHSSFIPSSRPSQPSLTTASHCHRWTTQQQSPRHSPPSRDPAHPGARYTTRTQTLRLLPNLSIGGSAQQPLKTRTTTTCITHLAAYPYTIHKPRSISSFNLARLVSHNARQFRSLPSSYTAARASHRVASSISTTAASVRVRYY